MDTYPNQPVAVLARAAIPPRRCHEADKRDKNVQLVGPMITGTNLRKLIDRILASKCEVVKMGADVHARDIVAAVQLDGALPQKPVRLDSEDLVALVRALVKAGRTVHVCQEAGPCGFGLHRRLLAAGAQSLVVVPTALADGRQQKTDGLDATALVDKLDRYLRGNTKAFTTITVPTVRKLRGHYDMFAISFL